MVATDAAEEPQKDLIVSGLGIESKTYGRVEPRTAAAGGEEGEEEPVGVGFFPVFLLFFLVFEGF